jgi:hypothetical protein
MAWERHGTCELAFKRTEPEKNVRNDCTLNVMNNIDESVLREITSVYWNDLSMYILRSKYIIYFLSKALRQ